MPGSIFWMLICSLLATDGPSANPAVTPIGSKVMTRYAKPLRVENRVVDPGSTTRIYTVEQEQGGFLWLRAGNVAGWLEVESVIPVDQAIAFYTREIETRGIGEAYNWRGCFLETQGKLAEASADFDQAIRIDPANPWPHQNKGLALRKLGRYHEALAELDEAIRLDPRNVNSWVNHASAALGAGLLDRAVADCDQALLLNPADASAYLVRGNARVQLRDFSAARADFDAATRHDPTSSLAYNNRGEARLFLGETSVQVLPDFDEAIRLDPANSRAQFNRAGMAVTRADRERAIHAFDELIRLAPGNATYFGHRGAVRLMLDDYDGALVDLDEAIRREPRSAQAYASRGEAWYNKEQAARALPDFDRAIELAPTHSRIYVCRGNAQKCLHAYDRALADYDAAVRLAPNYGSARNSQAWLLATCPDPKYRDGAKAVESATRACELAGGQDPETLDMLAAAYAERGDFDQARAQAHRAIDLATSPQSRQEFQARLALYDRRQPYRTVECTHP